MGAVPPPLPNFFSLEFNMFFFFLKKGLLKRINLFLKC